MAFVLHWNYAQRAICYLASTLDTVIKKINLKSVFFFIVEKHQSCF